MLIVDPGTLRGETKRNPGLSLTSSASWSAWRWGRCRSSCKSSHSPSWPSLWKSSPISGTSVTISILTFGVGIIQVEQGTEKEYKESKEAKNHVLDVIHSKGASLLKTPISTDENHIGVRRRRMARKLDCVSPKVQQLTMIIDNAMAQFNLTLVY